MLDDAVIVNPVLDGEVTQNPRFNLLFTGVNNMIGVLLNVRLNEEKVTEQVVEEENVQMPTFLPFGIRYLVVEVPKVKLGSLSPTI